MRDKKCIAMILAEGKEAKLGTLTGKYSIASSIHFGGKYRIIDFALSNCKHSGIDTVGILTQCRYSSLHEYIGNGHTWGLDRTDSGLFMLSARKKGVYYTGNADAVYKNLEFIEHFNPENILIIPGGHIYKMDYGKMLSFHKKNNADATIAGSAVSWEEASDLDIITASKDGFINEFAAKPALPQSNIASMGVYIFKWERLKKFLMADKNNIMSKNDFAKNIIPDMLSTNEQLYLYEHKGYWKNINTIFHLWEANMELLQENPKVNIYDEKWKVLTKATWRPPCNISGQAEIKNSIIGDGCFISGRLENSVLFDSVKVGEGSEIIDSIIMPGAIINKNAYIYKAVVGANAIFEKNVEIGAERGVLDFYDSKICSKDISLIGPGIYIGQDVKITKNSHVDRTLPSHERQEVSIEQEMNINNAMANMELMYV